MTALPQTRITAEEYLTLERAAPDHPKHEFLNGEMPTMPGASPRHVLVTTNVVGELGAALKDRPCLVFSADLRLRVSPTGLYTYPDVMVICGPLETTDDRKDTVTNPVLIVEVLSPSTEDWDRGGKFAHYRTLPSLRDYLLVAQNPTHVELFSRPADGRWILWESDDPAAEIALDSLGLKLPVASLYAKVELLPVD